MNRIGSGPLIQSSYGKGVSNYYRTAGTSTKNSQPGVASYGTVPQKDTDNLLLSGSQDPEALDCLVSDLFDVLSREYPDITILGQNQGGTEDVRQIAAELGNGTYVVLSKEFLERMKKSQEDFETCKAVLKDALHRLSSGGATEGTKTIASGVYLKESSSLFWSVSKPIQPEDANNSEDKGAFGLTGSSDNWLKDYMNTSTKKNPLRVSVSTYSTTGQYASMARAGSKSEVRMVIADVHRSIGSLQTVASCGDDKQRVKAQRAISSLRKLLVRGGRKIRRFNEEDILHMQKKRAEEAQKKRKVQQIRMELKKQRSARSGADSRLVKEGIYDTYTIYGGKHSRYEDQLERQLAALDCAPGTAGMAGMEIGAGTGGGMEFSEGDIMVTSGESF